MRGVESGVSPMTRFVPALLLALLNASPAQDLRTIEIEELTIPELQEGMASGKWSARHLVELYSERIAKIDRSGATLRSVIEMNPDALTIADGLRCRTESGKVSPPAARDSHSHQRQHR